jgi:hypothetical protein
MPEAMNHPERDAWVPYLFRESSPEETARLDAHLAECAECRAQIEGWRGSLGRLDRWTIPTLRRDPVAPGLPGPMAAILRWAAVVMVSALVGAVAGGWATRRALATTAATPTEVVAAGTPSVRVAVDVAPGGSAGSGGEVALSRDVVVLRGLVDQLRNRQEAGFLELRRDLETVASTTEAALRQTRRGLIEVAGYRRSVETP